MKFLIVFRAFRSEFWYEELHSVFKLYDIDVDNVFGSDFVDKRDILFPYLTVNFESIDIANKVALRCCLIRYILELWADSDTYKGILTLCNDSFQQQNTNFSKFISPSNVEEWRLDIASFGSTLSMAEQKERRDILLDLNFTGKINLSNKETYKTVNRFLLLEHLTITSETSDKTLNKMKKPSRLFFGRVIGKGMNEVLDLYNLKKRLFLGPTSTESELSFLMANQSLAQKGKLILDPFVGTGSLLISCTHFESVCMGSDIDTRILHGKKKLNLFENFIKYKLTKPEIIRMDYSPLGLCYRNLPKGLFDAIICDPPYGIRAGARKTGRKKKKNEKVEEIDEKLEDYGNKYRGHIPQTDIYKPEDLLPDLVDTSAKLLKLKGRLVYLLPVAVEFYSEEMLPTHPCFKLISNCEDFLSLRVSRRLITMEKIEEYDWTRVDEYKVHVDKCKKILTEKNQLIGQDKQNITACNGEIITDKKERRKIRREYVKKQKKQRKFGKTAQLP